MKKLKEHQLFCRLKKCQFEVEEVKFLGLVVGRGEVKVADEKIEAIVNEKPPRTKKGVQRFLGMANGSSWISQR